MAALDFPSSPTLNQQFAAPNGVTYKWDGTAWVVLGGAGLWTQTAKELLPTDATVTDVRTGAGQTVQTRVGSWGTAWANAAGISTNEALAAGGAPDEPTKPQTEFDLDNDGKSLYFFVKTPTSPGPAVKTNVLLVNGATSPPGDLTITGNNATKASGTTWANPSDPRLKDDVTPYPHGLADILQLEPISYTWNGLAGTPAGMRTCGFDAEAVRAIFPDCVTATRGKLHPDDEEEETDILSLDIHGILIALVNAVKELAAAHA